MTGPKLNESPVLRRRPQSRAQPVTGDVRSARAVARFLRVSPYKVREVLDLIRGHDAERAVNILRFCERDAAEVVGKALASAMANAEKNHALIPDELYVSACYADEGPTLKRWRPRARGRATRIRKRTCHVTVIVSRLPDSELQTRRGQGIPGGADRRRRRAGQEEAARRRQTATPDETTTPEAAGTTPDETATTPDETGTTPDETATTPDETGTTPDETGTTPDETGTTPDETGTTPEETAIAADETATTPEEAPAAPSTEDAAEGEDQGQPETIESRTEQAPRESIEEPAEGSDGDSGDKS